MSVEKSTLGRCPFCGSPVPAANTLIEYAGGVYAECPECTEPVNPT